MVIRRFRQLFGFGTTALESAAPALRALVAARRAAYIGAMSKDSPLFERIKGARAVQVGVLYLGASWAVLQLVGTLMEMLGLPDWLGPTTVVLLGVGFLVVIATAWVQSLESTTRAEQAGEVPTDWQVDPADALASLKAGRLPHLTWGRALVGGVVALSLTIAAAGAFVLLGGGQSFIRAVPASADEAAEGIAVLPFEADGADVEFMREGMVRLVSASFDGVGDFRTIDSRTVLARYDEEVGGESRPDLASMLRVAERAGARYAILGSVVPAGPTVRVNAALYDVSDGSNVGDVQVEGTAEGILELVDRLTVEIATELLGATGAEEAMSRTLASITTESPEALKIYLDGERLLRGGEVDDAAERFEEALRVDSTFALAWMRLNDADGWTPQQARGNVAMDQARRFRERLSRRRDELLTARSSGRAAGIPLLQAYVRRYPDDAEAWHRLGDYALHRILEERGVPDFSIEAMAGALERAVELDPGFAPYRIHIVELALLRADSLAARQTIDAYWENGGAENRFSESWDASFRLFFGLESGVPSALADVLDRRGPRLGLIAASVGADLRSRDLEYRRTREERGGGSRAPWLLHAGRLREWRTVTEDVSGLQNGPTPVLPSFMARQQYGVAELDPDRWHVDAATECGDADACLQATLGLLLHAAAEGHQAEYEEAVGAWDRRVADALQAAANGSGSQQDTAVVRNNLESFRAWADLAAGDPRAALERWRLFSGRTYRVGARILGMALAFEAENDLERAEQHYRAALFMPERPVATYRLARLFERTGRTSEALTEYRRLEMMWADADLDFPPWVETRAALTRLAG